MFSTPLYGLLFISSHFSSILHPSSPTLLHPPSQINTSFTSTHSSLTLILSTIMPAKPAAGKPARGWDASSHEDLLLAILEEIKPNKSDLTSVAEKMRNKGYSYSYDAIKYF